MDNGTNQYTAEQFGSPTGLPPAPDALPGSRAFWDQPPSDRRGSELRVVNGGANGVVVRLIEPETPMQKADVLPGDRMFWASPLTERPLPESPLKRRRLSVAVPVREGGLPESE